MGKPPILGNHTDVALDAVPIFDAAIQGAVRILGRFGDPKNWKYRMIPKWCDVTLINSCNYLTINRPSSCHSGQPLLESSIFDQNWCSFLHGVVNPVRAYGTSTCFKPQYNEGWQLMDGLPQVTLLWRRTCTKALRHSGTRRTRMCLVETFTSCAYRLSKQKICGYESINQQSSASLGSKTAFSLNVPFWNC